MSSSSSSSLRFAPTFRPHPSCGGYQLDIIRAGELGERLPLTREVTTFGRDAASVDVAVLHESCSRVHAALSVDASSGKLYICDQGSANGSFLNKARLPAGKWILLSEGASFRLGESSRLYVVIEPAGGASAAIVKSAVASSAAAPKGSAASSEKEEAVVSGDAAMIATIRAGGGGAREGSERDASELRGGSSSRSWFESIDLNTLSEKERALHAKTLALARKLANVVVEGERIAAKEGAQEAGLTEGQRAALERTATAQEMLRVQVREARDALQARLEAKLPGSTGQAQPQAGATASGGAAAEDINGFLLHDASSPDDVVDRTRLARAPKTSFQLSTTKSNTAASLQLTAAQRPLASAALPVPVMSSSATVAAAAPVGVETEASLRAKLEGVRSRLTALRAQREPVARPAAASLSPADDTLDTYMVQSALNAAADARAARSAEMIGLAERESELSGLLALVAAPSLQPETLAPITAVAAQSTTSAPQAATQIRESAEGPSADASSNARPEAPPPVSFDSDGFAMPAPRLDRAKIAPADTGAERATAPADRSAPPAKRPRPQTSAPRQEAAFDSDGIVDLTRF